MDRFCIVDILIQAPVSRAEEDQECVAFWLGTFCFLIHFTSITSPGAIETTIICDARNVIDPTASCIKTLLPNVGALEFLL